MRATLVLGLALVGCLAVSGSSLAIMSTIDQVSSYASAAGNAALSLGNAVQTDPASAPDAAQAFAGAELAAAQSPLGMATNLAVSNAYWASGQAYGCSHVEARCFAFEVVPQLPDAGGLAGAGVALACEQGALAPAGAQLGLSYGDVGFGIEAGVQLC